MLSAAQRVHLRIVEADEVRVHEIADPAREKRIEVRLRADGVLRDPLMVGTVPELGAYVLLDGTNRKRALAALKLRRLLVQVLDYADSHAVELRTWCHAAAQPTETILEGARSIAGIAIEKLQPLEAGDVLREPRTLAVALGKNKRYSLMRDGTHVHPRSMQLRQLVDLYEDQLVRQDCDADSVEERAAALAGRSPEPVTLLAFPPISKAQVLSMAMEHVPIPAGITRHVIRAGRALRVNVPLDLLDGALDLDDANARLGRHLESLRPRYYQEPTILFDS